MKGMDPDQKEIYKAFGVKQVDGIKSKKSQQSSLRKNENNTDN